MNKIYKPQAYKNSELNNKSGIYQIRNIINNKIYIGSTKNLNRRRKEHFGLLRLNKHCNTKLQNSFNKYGKENFIFEVVEFCEIEYLTECEQYWIDKLNVFKNGYNENPRANMPPILKGELNGMYNRYHTEESKKLMSLHKIGTQVYGDNPRAIPIICLTDGKKFDCMQRCIEYYHRDRSSIYYNLQYRYLDPELRFMFLNKYNELIEQGLNHEDIIQFHRNSYKKPCKS